MPRWVRKLKLLPAAEEADDDNPLLAEPDTEPGQRDDNGYMRVKAPRWKQGARKRSYLSSSGTNLASSSHRNLFKGWSGEMGPLSRGVVGEEIDKDEKIIIEAQNHVKKLINQLEQKDEN